MRVAPAADFADVMGQTHQASSMDLRARLVFLGKCRQRMAGTGSMCTAAASRVRGSIVKRPIRPVAALCETLRIGHPLGVMEVKLVAGAPDAGAKTPSVRFKALGFTRIVRRLLAGTVCVPGPRLPGLGRGQCFGT